MKRNVILTCAVTGEAPFNPKHPNFPDTPAKIADAAIEAARAGASIAHIHARDPITKEGTRDVRYYSEIVDRIRQSGEDIVLNLTCGHGATLFPDPDNEAVGLPESDVVSAAERVAHLAKCLPEIASLDVTTGNQVEGGVDYVYLNTTRTLREMARLFRHYGVKPEIEVFGVGDILFANSMVADGLIDEPPLYQMVLGVDWASPSDPKTVQYLLEYLPDAAPWIALGIGREQMRMAALSVIMGGNVRVGLEDNLYLDRGIFATNGQLVERARTIIEALGENVATPDQTREILNLKNTSRDLTRRNETKTAAHG